MDNSLEEGVTLPEDTKTEVEPVLIKEDEEMILNKTIAAVAGSYFRALASISDEEIYALAYTDAGKNSPRLLDVVNSAFVNMLVCGGSLPRGHFDHYKKLVSDFNNTLVFNIEAKLDDNRDLLVARTIGKTSTPDRISHQDIIDALAK